MKLEKTLGALVAAGLFVFGMNFVFAGETEAAKNDKDTPELGVLVSGKGAEETFAYCTACHSERIVAQQGLSRNAWIELLEWMVEEQGMAEIEEPEYTLVIDYLEKNYGEDRPNFPKN